MIYPNICYLDACEIPSLRTENENQFSVSFYSQLLEAKNGVFSLYFTNILKTQYLVFYRFKVPQIVGDSSYTIEVYVKKNSSQYLSIW